MSLRAAIGFGLFLVAMTGCGRSNFTASTAKKSAPTDKMPGELDSNANGAVQFDLACGDGQSVIAKAIDGRAHSLRMPVTCGQKSDKVTSVEVKDPLDFVFVLDITGSMGPNINAVKDGVKGFAQKMSEKGWDANFAAVGYRDTVDKKTNFMNAAALSTEVSSWSASGGGDDQEAGQLGIQSAVSQIVKEGRSNSKKIILLVSDVIFFAGTNHNDFTVTALSKEIKDLGIKGLEIYCSVPIGVFPITPIQQCNNLRQESAIPGANIPFPLKQEALIGEFAARIEENKVSESMQCRLSNVKITDLTGAIILNEEIPASSAGETISLPLGDAAKVRALSTSAKVEMERCCNRNGSAPGACEEKKVSTAPFVL